MYISKLFLNRKNIGGLKQKYGRNNQGKISVRYRKKGHKKLYRYIKQNSLINKKLMIVSIELNPFNNKFLARVNYKENGIFKDAFCEINNETNVLNLVQPANKNTKNNNVTSKLFKLKDLSIGDIVSNIEKKPGEGPVYAKSAGTFAQIIKHLNKKNRNMVQVRLPSKEQYFFDSESLCLQGRNNNLFYKQLKKWKAGNSQHLGVRSKVRGVAKNPVDHPHGGGEGKGYIGRAPVNPQGKLTKCVPTRKKKKNSFFIALRRNKV